MNRPSVDDLATLISAFADAHVLVVGDVMLDRYIYGTVERISPEAPIPVLHVARESTMLGGAGNVARNLAAISAHVTFATVAGDDSPGHEVVRLMRGERAIEPRVILASGRITSVKSRFIAGTQQLMRADSETIAPLSPVARQDLLVQLEPALRACDIVVLSDYGKGVLSGGVAATVIQAAREAGRRVVVDPKGRDYRCYAGADVLTPNARELAEVTGLPTLDDNEVEEAGRAVIRMAGVHAILATRGAHGVTLVPRDGPALHLPARAVEVFDVSGAGDTVIAVLAAALAGGASLPEAAALANVAGGVVVAKLGTATCSLVELAAALAGTRAEGHAAKVVDRDRLVTLVARWRASGLKVGFTNGCFDLLHPGHVSLLRQARAACDRLVVGLNSDASVHRLKGEGRPVNGEAARAAVLAALADVDLVSVFDEDTPLELIELVRPNVLVKGADYTRETVVGAEQVEGWGGRVLLAALTPSFSTTQTIKRMLS